jgi:hypothetical protein
MTRVASASWYWLLPATFGCGFGGSPRKTTTVADDKDTWVGPRAPGWKLLGVCLKHTGKDPTEEEKKSGRRCRNGSLRKSSNSILKQDRATIRRIGQKIITKTTPAAGAAASIATW